MLKWIAAFLIASSSGFCLSIGVEPTTLIQSTSASKLDRPESVAFTPSGDYVAVGNSLADTITFYKRIGESGAAYETVPSYSIDGPESELDYPHDICFSPDGLHLAVANRLGNSILIYKKNLSQNRYDPVPITAIKGWNSRLAHPDSVRYSPVDNIIAVANMDTNALTFYSYQQDQYSQIPCQVILSPDLKVPDGLSFSKDGQLLAVTSHDSHNVFLFQKRSGSLGLFLYQPVQVLQGEETHFCYPHSLTFHPFKDYLAVSNSQGRKNVNVFARESEGAAAYLNAPEISLEIVEMYDETTIGFLEKLWQEGGVKGIAFAPDGKSLAITQNLCQDTLRLPFPVGVVAIYPVQTE